MKQPNWKTPVFLMGALGLIGGLTYWLEYSHKPKKEKEDTAIKKPINLPSTETQIASFVMRGAKINLSAKCDSLAQKKCKPTETAEWSLTAPQDFKGDSENLKAFVSSIADAVAPDTIDLSEETAEKRQKILEDYGLSEAKRNAVTTPMVEFTLDSGKKLAIWFGVEHPLGDKNFVASAEDGKLNDKTIFLLSSFAKGAVDHDLTYFRDKSIFAFNHLEVDSFTSKTSGGSMDAKKANAQWVINGLEVESDRVAALITYIASMKAKDFPGSKDVLKGAKSILNFKLITPKEKISLELFEKNAPGSKAASANDSTQEKHYYLSTSVRPDPVEVEAFARSQLDKKANNYRNLDLLPPAAKPSISHLKLEGKKFKSPVEFEMKNSKFTGLGPKGATLNGGMASLLIDAFSNHKIKEFISPPPAGVEEVKVTFGDDKEPTKYRWVVYQQKEKIFVRDLGNKRNEAYEVPFVIKNALPVDGESWIIK